MTFEEVQEKTKTLIDQTNNKIEELGVYTNDLSIVLNEIQNAFDDIRGIPSEQMLQLEEVRKIRLNWLNQVKKIEEDLKSSKIVTTGAGAAGAGVGIAVVALGPTVAMGVATTFGVASTGTAIATLSGAAASNAALAWLGGGALAAGGGGIAAGNFFLFLTGPVGIGIAILSISSSGLLLLKAKTAKNRAQSLFKAIGERDIKSYQLAIIELEARIIRIKDETGIIKDAIIEAKQYGNQYELMSEEQQYNLISFVNLMNSSIQLLINPILGLQPKYTIEDLNKYIEFSKEESYFSNESLKSIFVYLGNLLYKIDIDDTDKKILWKSISKNTELLEEMSLNKKDFSIEYMSILDKALDHKYILQSVKGH